MTAPHINYPTSRAILIGTSKYQDRRFPDVPAVENSLHGMYSALTDPRLGGWPKEHVESWLNVTKDAQIASELRRLAASATDVLFFYFAGHGVMTSRHRELCLILTDSERENPDLTGLEFERVRRVLEDSQARIKIVILDCCYSNRAIENSPQYLSADDVSGIAEIEGAYTLVATNPSSKLARISALTGETDNTATAFTRELLELIYQGIPGKPEFLTLGDIYDPLLIRLQQLDLPASRRNVTNTADHLAFMRNIAYGTSAQDASRRPTISARPRPNRWQRVTQRVSRRDVLIAAGSAVVAAAAGTVVGLWPDSPRAHASGKPVAVLLGTAETSHTAGAWQVAAGQLSHRPIAVSSGGDHQILLWDLIRRQRLGHAMRGHRAGVRGLATITVQGRLVAVSGSDDTTVRIWDLATQKEIGSPMTGHTDYVRGIATAMVKGRPVAVSASLDKTARVWDLIAHTETGAVLLHPAKVHNVATGILGGIPIAVTGAQDGIARIWNLQTHEQIDTPMIVQDPPGDVVEAVSVGSLNGQPIAVTGGSDRYVRWWNLKDGQPAGSPLGRQTDEVWGTVIGSLSGQAIAVSVGDGTGRVWNLSQGGNLQTTLDGGVDSVWGVALSQVNGHTMVVTGCLDGRVRLWDLGTD